MCRVLARPRMLPAFHLLPRLPNPARPAAEYDARAFDGSGIGLTVRRKPLTKPQLQNFSRTQEVHPLWVREIDLRVQRISRNTDCTRAKLIVLSPYMHANVFRRSTEKI